MVTLIRPAAATIAVGSVIPEQSSPLPSRAVTDFTGAPCLVLGGQVVTTVVAGVVTPSGQVKLTCKS